MYVALFSFLRQVYVPGGPHMMHMRLYSIPVASPALPAAAAHRERPALKPQASGEAVPLGRLPAHGSTCTTCPLVPHD